MSDTLSGFLLWSEEDALRTALDRPARLKREHDNIGGWRLFDYVVEENIPQVDVEGTSPYTHRLFVRRGGDRLILVSNNFHVCDHFIERDLRPVLNAYLRKADISVHDLVRLMTGFWTAIDGEGAGEVSHSPALPTEVSHAEWAAFNHEYTLGYASARTDAFSGNLQKLEFQGENLPSSSFFVEALPLTRFWSCGLRRKAVNDQGYPDSYEILRLGKSGFLSFAAPGSMRDRQLRFRDIEVLLRALRKFGFIR
jgi:hypothetical protein